MKVKEKHVKKIIPKQIKKIVNNKKSKLSEKRKNSVKKKLQISKTLSMENISTGPKYTTRQKSSISNKLFNNSLEEIDYLNFSDIDIDLIKKIATYEKDIFKPEFNSKNQKEQNDIVQNRYNMIDTSFDTNQQNEILNKIEDEYIDINKNILIKTPSTICNYYDMDSNKKKIEENKIEEKKIENKKKKKFKNKQIQINKNSIINYNNQIYTNRTKPFKYNSSSNINLAPSSRRLYNNTNVGFYKTKKCTNNIISNRNLKNSKEIITPVLKDRNKEISNKMSRQTKKDKANLTKSYLDSNNKKYNNKTHSNKNKKCLSIKQYSEYISSKVIKRVKNTSNCNFTFNNDITSLIKNQQNIQDLFDSIKEIRETINNNIDKNVLDESNKKKEIKTKQKPILLSLNKPKYFKTPKNSNSAQKEKKSTNTLNNNKEMNLGKNNMVVTNYTGRNYQKSCESTRREIVVKRKKKLKENNFGFSYINYCTKSINSIKSTKFNNNNLTKMNTTFHNYINDCLNTPIIKVNLKKHLKSSSQLMQFINVNSKSTKSKSKSNPKIIKNNSRGLLNNKSFINTCAKRSINTSQLIKELLSKKNMLKSPKQIKNNNSMLKTSKTSKENNSSFISKIKNESAKKIKVENNSIYNHKKNIFGNNNKKYYSIKYEISLRSNGNSKIDRNNNKIWNKNNKNKNYFKPKTQSDIKVHKFNIKEDKNRENILKNENEEYGMDKRIKQKLIDRMNKVTKNTFGNIWGVKKKEDNYSEIMKSPFKNKDYSNTNKNFYNKKIISNENSKNEERDFKNEKSIEKRNKFEFKIIKDYNGMNTYNNLY